MSDPESFQRDFHFKVLKAIADPSGTEPITNLDESIISAIIGKNKDDIKDILAFNDEKKMAEIDAIFDKLDIPLLIAREVAKWVKNNAYDYDPDEKKWEQRDIREQGETNNLSAIVHLKCQEAMIKLFGENIEKEVNPTPFKDDRFASKFSSHKLPRFDFYLPEFKTAIELCFSNLSNEIFKDILKAQSDRDITNFYIIGTSHKRATALKVWNRPSSQVFLESLKNPGNILEKEPSIVYFDESDKIQVKGLVKGEESNEYSEEEDPEEEEFEDEGE